MSLEDYLKQNIKAEVLQKTNEFKSSSTYKTIVDYSSSKKYQAAKMRLKIRDKNVHRTTLSDIQRLQEQVLLG